MANKHTPETPRLIISPDNTTIDDVITEPRAIVIILPSGSGYSIEETIAILEAHHKKHAKKPAFRRIKRFKAAFTNATREAFAED